METRNNPIELYNCLDYQLYFQTLCYENGEGITFEESEISGHRHGGKKKSSVPDKKYEFLYRNKEGKAVIMSAIDFDALCSLVNATFRGENLDMDWLEKSGKDSVGNAHAKSLREKLIPNGLAERVSELSTKYVSSGIVSEGTYSSIVSYPTSEPYLSSDTRDRDPVLLG